MVQVIRVVSGLLFIISGLVKANDPAGLSYKMQEFFEAWGWTALHDYTLVLSITMNLFEVVAGVALLVGWRFRIISWLLLLLMVAFTFLTAYAVFSGKIKTCGCFGDCLPLTAMSSFIKDVVLLIFILILLWRWRDVKPLWRKNLATVIVVVSGVLTMALQLYVLKYLPVVDCLPYKKGNNILQQMQPPPGAVPDSFAISFKYKKDGKILEFGAEDFPEDFDETYEYVDRYDKLVRKGTGKPAITDFYLATQGSTDTTKALLSGDDYYVLVIAKDMSTINDWAKVYMQVADVARQQQIPVYIVTSTPGDARRYFDDSIILTSDAVVLKTAARVNSTFFLMKGARVIEKVSYASPHRLTRQIQALR